MARLAPKFQQRVRCPVFRFLPCIVLTLWLPVAAVAQTLPDYVSPYINDFASLLTEEQTRKTLEDRLILLRQDKGIEMTVVTLPGQAPYAPAATLEEFATGLFNHWGVGNADRNDGIMVLVLPEDRAMRIELGAGYGRDWDGVAQRIVDTEFLPRFRQDNYPAGIMAGSAAVIDRIALPFAEGKAAPTPSNDDAVPWIVMGLFGGLALVLGQRRRIGDVFTLLRTCPQCEAKGTLRVTRRTLMSATTTSGGQIERTVTCTNCDYHDERIIHTSRRSSSTGRSGSFGGGRSGGGGASGRW